MHFRIGINPGDVVDEGNPIYGKGVNIAGRREGLVGFFEILDEVAQKTPHKMLK
jgi:hypothetical protein